LPRRIAQVGKHFQKHPVNNCLSALQEIGRRVGVLLSRRAQQSESFIWWYLVEVHQCVLKNASGPNSLVDQV
jgi:hypothetical protein